MYDRNNDREQRREREKLQEHKVLANLDIFSVLGNVIAKI